MTSRIEGYRISVQQGRLWRLREHDWPTWAQQLVHVDGPLDPARLVAAMDEVVERYDILRTTYHQAPGLRAVLQVVHDCGDLSARWMTEDLRRLDDEAQRRRVAAVAEARRRVPFDLERGPLLSVVRFDLARHRHALLITTTALAADGETLRHVAAELARCYAGAGGSFEPTLRYAEFAQWQHERAVDGPAPAADAVPRRRTSWLPLQIGRADAAQHGHTRTSALSSATFDRLREFAADSRIRPESVLLTAWHVLLWKIAGGAGTTVGVGVSGRRYEETVGCPGPFTSWVAIPLRPADDASFDTLVGEVDRMLLAAEESDEPLLSTHADEITTWDVAFECRPAAGVHRAGAVAFRVLWDDVAAEPYGVKLECLLGAEGATVVLHFRRDRFTDEYVDCLIEQYHTLLGNLLTAPSASIAKGSALDPATRTEILRRVNGEGATAPVGQCLHSLIEAEVHRSPDAIAVVSGALKLTYRDLDTWADHLAARLRQRGVTTETVVGVCLGHTAQLVVALLAVLKAGGAYLPLDPALPDQRLRKLVSLAGCRLVLTDGAGESRWTDSAVELMDVENPGATDQPYNDPRSGVLPDNLAYMMFTSGSTGVPKGVMLSHGALTGYLLWALDTYCAGDGDGALVHSSIAFDLTVTSVFVPLLAGRTVWLDTAWRKVHALGAELGGRRHLDLLKVTPAHVTALDQAVEREDLRDTTHCLVVGGDVLHWDDIHRWREHAPLTRIFNEYGPTETAVGCCVYEVDGTVREGSAVPIGRAVAGAELYVLDASLEPVPVGMPGELYIGGAGLARGYLASPALSAERFVPHPYASRPGQRLYRTGDLACHGTDGQLRFLGRVDEQIKVNGIRVELAELRTALREHPVVVDAVVLRRTGKGEVIAFLVAAAGADRPAEADMRAFLGERLAAELVPVRYRWVDEIPLTVNGKVDRDRLLAAPDPVHAARLSTVAPADAVELGVVRVFEELLGADEVGVDDDFFDLGGHSMLAVKLIARINAAFGRQLQLAVLFEEPRPDQPGRPGTPRHLAGVLRGQGAERQAGYLVRLRGGEATPLFCVHPAGGEVLGFRDLSLSSALCRPMYGLQAPPGSSEEVEQCVPRLAKRYLAEIRATRPDGPYLLLGWSMGGVVALEMAQQLRRAGAVVQMLVLVESYLRDQLPPFDGPDEVDDATASNPEVAQARRLHRAHVRAVRRYQPERYPGPVTLMQADEQPAALRAAAATAWAALCPQLAGAQRIAGDHYSSLRRPHVEQLADLIEQAVRCDRTD